MSVATVAVRASELGKRYRIGTRLDPDASLAASIARGITAPLRNFTNLRRLRHFDDAGEDATDVIWAFRDVSFEVYPGEVLGVIGRNGAGKSTLLKVLSRITEPTEGEAEIHGRVSSLLEVGAGFHGDLTGRDNVFLKGTLLGMTRREVAARFDEIVRFAELEQFIDTPVKRFSSGMYVRLAFSVAAHLDPDVLIADEVLAVGDAEFQRRSIGTMRSAAEEHGRTVIFVSHDLSVVASLCTRAIWLDHGRLRAAGDVDEVIDEYMHSLQHEESRDLARRTDRTGNGAVRATSVTVRSAGDGGRGAVPAGEPVEIRVNYEAPDGQPPGPITATVVIETLLRERVATLSTDFTGDRLEAPPSGTLTCVIDDFPINEGDYMCTVRIDVAGKVADWIADTTRFRVDPTSFYTGNAHPGPKGGRMLLRHRWRLDD
jgi:lipopolysaccharide transport system ATP-binding protein